MRKDYTSYAIYVAWIIVIILTLIPFFRIGFTTGDDIEYFLNGRQGWRYLFEETDRLAKEQGRFFFYLTMPLGNIPYLIDNFYFTKIVQYGSLILSYFLFAYFVFKIFKSRNLSLILLLMLATWMQVTFNHHIPITAYPFSFSFAFSLDIIACLLFIRYLETGRYKWVAWSALIFFSTLLFYENNILFLACWGVYILVRNIRRFSLNKVFVKSEFYKEIVPFILAGCIYIVVYTAFQHHFMTHYAGNALADNFSLSNFFQILWHCTTIMLPCMNFLMEQSAIEFNSVLLGGYTPSLLFALTHAPVRVYVWAFLACTLFIHYLHALHVSIPRRKLILGIAFALALSFLVHVLIAATRKYNTEWYIWMRGYTTSFYALFGITLALALCLFGILQMVRPYKWLYETITVMVTGLMFVTLVLTGMANDNLSREWQRSQNRFNMLDEMAKAGYFDQIPEGSILYGPDLQYSLNWGYHITKQPYGIGRYLNVRSGKTYFYETTPEGVRQTAAAHPEARIYCLQTGETVKAHELMLSVAEVGTGDELHEKPLEAWRAQTADIFYHSPTTDYVLLYTCDKAGRVTHNSFDTVASTVGLNRLRCRHPIRFGKLTRVSLTADASLLMPNDFSISNMIGTDGTR